MQSSNLKYTLRSYKASELSLGFHGNSCDFDWRAFEDRSPQAQEAYLRLERHIRQHGLLNPLITHQGHVLIGMRRFEIAMKLDSNPEQVFPCYEVLEDVSNWTRKDIDRLDDFKKEVYPDEGTAFVG